MNKNKNIVMHQERKVGGNMNDPLKSFENSLDIFMYKVIPIILIVLLLIIVGIIAYKIYLIKKQSLQFGNKNVKGIIFGKKLGKLFYSPTNNEGHIFVTGGSGVGKTSAILIPTLRCWSGTSFTIDISGDISSNLDIENKLVYSPETPNGVSYDVFKAIDLLPTLNDKNEALEQLALLIMPEELNMSDAGKFYLLEGRKILTASLIAFYHQGLDFIDICEKIFTSSWKELFTEIDVSNNHKAIGYINSFQGTSEINTSGCKQNCDNYIKLFATNETVKKSIHRNKNEKLSFSQSSIEKSNVFVVIPDSKLELYSSLLHIITAQCLEFFSNRSNNETSTILFSLDEFASLGKLEITPALRKLRKKKVRIMLLTQSMADIDLIYGRNERMAMLNNFNFKVILSASDTDTQEYFAKLIGYKKVKKESTSKGSMGTSTTTNMEKEYAIEPAELARLKNKLVLLHPDGYIKLKKNFYFKK